MRVPEGAKRQNSCLAAWRSSARTLAARNTCLSSGSCPARSSSSRKNSASSARRESRMRCGFRGLFAQVSTACGSPCSEAPWDIGRRASPNSGAVRRPLGAGVPVSNPGLTVRFVAQPTGGGRPCGPSRAVRRPGAEGPRVAFVSGSRLDPSPDRGRSWWGTAASFDRRRRAGGALPYARPMPGDDPSRTTRTPAAPPGAGGPRPAAAPTAAASEAAGSGRTSPSRTLFALATLAAGVCAAVVAQVFLAGLGLLVDPRYLAWHSSFVHVIEVAALALLALGMASRVGGLAALSVAPFVLTGAQYALIHGFDGPVRALHAVNAFAVFGASWALARRAAAASEPRVAGARLRPPQRPDARLGPTVAALSLVLVG